METCLLHHSPDSIAGNMLGYILCHLTNLMKMMMMVVMMIIIREDQQEKNVTVLALPIGVLAHKLNLKKLYKVPGLIFRL